MCDECTWHYETFLVQSVYWHLAVKLYMAGTILLTLWSALILTVFSVFHFQIAGIILDNFARGRTRHIWFTISGDLIVDARRLVYSLLPPTPGPPPQPIATTTHFVSFAITQVLCLLCHTDFLMGKRSALIVLFLFLFLFFVSFFLFYFFLAQVLQLLPSYNRNGWLGVKHQVTY